MPLGQRACRCSFRRFKPHRRPGCRVALRRSAGGLQEFRAAPYLQPKAGNWCRKGRGHPKPIASWNRAQIFRLSAPVGIPPWPAGASRRAPAHPPTDPPVCKREVHPLPNGWRTQLPISAPSLPALLLSCVLLRMPLALSCEVGQIPLCSSGSRQDSFAANTADESFAQACETKAAADAKRLYSAGRGKCGGDIGWKRIES